MIHCRLLIVSNEGDVTSEDGCDNKCPFSFQGRRHCTSKTGKCDRHDTNESRKRKKTAKKTIACKVRGQKNGLEEVSSHKRKYSLFLLSIHSTSQASSKTESAFCHAFIQNGQYQWKNFAVSLSITCLFFAVR